MQRRAQQHAGERKQADDDDVSDWTPAAHAPAHGDWRLFALQTEQPAPVMLPLPPMFDPALKAHAIVISDSDEESDEDSDDDSVAIIDAPFHSAPIAKHEDDAPMSEEKEAALDEDDADDVADPEPSELDLQLKTLDPRLQTFILKIARAKEAPIADERASDPLAAESAMATDSMEPPRLVSSQSDPTRFHTRLPSISEDAQQQMSDGEERKEGALSARASALSPPLLMRARSTPTQTHRRSGRSPAPTPAAAAAAAAIAAASAFPSPGIEYFGTHPFKWENAFPGTEACSCFRWEDDTIVHTCSKTPLDFEFITATVDHPSNVLDSCPAAEYDDNRVGCECEDGICGPDCSCVDPTVAERYTAKGRIKIGAAMQRYKECYDKCSCACNARATVAAPAEAAAAPARFLSKRQTARRKNAASAAPLRPPCPYRVVQYGPVSADVDLVVFRRADVGWGVKTLKEIPPCVFVLDYIGERIHELMVDMRGHRYVAVGIPQYFIAPVSRAEDHIEPSQHLASEDSDDQSSGRSSELSRPHGTVHNTANEPYTIDAMRRGNISRFLNHSCSPNLIAVEVFIERQDPRQVHVALFSAVRIPAGAELTFNYAPNTEAEEAGGFQCKCGSAKCIHRRSAAGSRQSSGSSRGHKRARASPLSPTTRGKLRQSKSPRFRSSDSSDDGHGDDAKAAAAAGASSAVRSLHAEMSRAGAAGPAVLHGWAQKPAPKPSASPPPAIDLIESDQGSASSSEESEAEAGESDPSEEDSDSDPTFTRRRAAPAAATAAALSSRRPVTPPPSFPHESRKFPSAAHPLQYYPASSALDAAVLLVFANDVFRALGVYVGNAGSGMLPFREGEEKVKVKWKHMSHGMWTMTKAGVRRAIKKAAPDAPFRAFVVQELLPNMIEWTGWPNVDGAQ